MEVPRVRRTTVSTYQTLLAGWTLIGRTLMGRTSLGRSAPEGGKEDRKPRQRPEEQLAALRSSPSVRKTRSEIPSGFCTRPEFYTRSAATTRPRSRRNRGSFVVKGLFRFLQIPRLVNTRPPNVQIKHTSLQHLRTALIAVFTVRPRKARS